MANRRVWLAALLIGAGLAAGCGGSDGDGPEGTTTAAAPARTEAEAVDVADEAVQVAEEAEATPDASAGSVTVYRDTWGVPHIVADSLELAAYGIGYAQAEDRLADLYTNVRIAVGSLAEVAGREHVQQDYIMRLVRNAERAKAYYEQEAPPHLRAIAERFVQGVAAYERDHPEARPPHALALEPWHALAVGNAMILRWPIGTIFGDLERGGGKAPAMGSNGWCIAPDRTEEGCAVLLTDPHLTWEGLAVFHEARIHTPEANLSGFGLVGAPLIVLGHNDHVAWACTTGGPDTSDVYEITLNPENPMQYRYDGAWRTAEVGAITVPVAGGEPVTRMCAYTHLGPVISDPDLERGTAYVGASPYLTHTDLFAQVYAMNTARDAGEFHEALAMNQFMEQNILFADTQGTIGYVRTGATPIRPEGYDWRAPVPGDTSATAWLGVHDIADLVQCIDPPQGFLQNCNVSPAVMTVDSPMTPEKYPDYIYNVSWDQQNLRSERAFAVLSQETPLTKQELMDLTLDVTDIRATAWQEALRQAAAHDASGAIEDPDVAAALEATLAWDGRYTADSRGSVAMRFWREACQRAEVDGEAVIAGVALSEEASAELFAIFASVVREMKAAYGTVDLTWGDVHQVGRSGMLYPAPGAEYGGGAFEAETLFDVRGRRQEDGTYLADNGSFATQLIFLRPEGVESYTVVPWGQSGDPDSPHHMDQGERLYSMLRMKPTWFDLEELRAHVASELSLDVP